MNFLIVFLSFIHNFQYNCYTGSFWNKVRIGDALEFDINLVLKLPIKTELFRLEKSVDGHISASLPGDFINTVTKPAVITIIRKLIERFFEYNHINGRYYLTMKNIHGWMQSLVDRAKDRLRHTNVKSICFRINKH